MNPKVVTIDPRSPQAAILARAGEVLRAGGLVAFPTETVYGLGANALNPAAVKRIFEAKQRPATNPLIVHVAAMAEVDQVAADWPETAARLAARFWPGPLTLVLHKTKHVPDIVTAGGPTVAMRLPAHPVAQGVIRAAGVPIAAPSANASRHISATRAEHVLRSLGECVDLLLDGGATPGGLESAVLDLTVSPPRLLRPGLITAAEIEAIIGSIDIPQRFAAAPDGAPARSPGLLARHYAPRVPLECVVGDGRARVEELRLRGRRVGWLAFGLAAGARLSGVFVVEMPTSPSSYAAELYAALHALEAAAVDLIVVALPPEGEDWRAVRDRLGRAAAPL